MKVHIRDDNKVVLDELPQRREFVFEPADAAHFAMSVAEAAARCGYSQAKAQVLAHVESQMQARITEEIRTMMIQRAAFILPQLIEHKLSPGQAAVRIVDVVLNAAQGRVVT